MAPGLLYLSTESERVHMILKLKTSVFVTLLATTLAMAHATSAYAADDDDQIITPPKTAPSPGGSATSSGVKSSDESDNSSGGGKTKSLTEKLVGGLAVTVAEGFAARSLVSALVLTPIGPTPFIKKLAKLLRVKPPESAILTYDPAGNPIKQASAPVPKLKFLKRAGFAAGLGYVGYAIGYYGYHDGDSTDYNGPKAGQPNKVKPKGNFPDPKTHSQKDFADWFLNHDMNDGESHLIEELYTKIGHPELANQFYQKYWEYYNAPEDKKDALKDAIGAKFINVTVKDEKTGNESPLTDDDYKIINQILGQFDKAISGPVPGNPALELKSGEKPGASQPEPEAKVESNDDQLQTGNGGAEEVIFSHDSPTKQLGGAAAGR